jgi:hypothetical protein
VFSAKKKGPAINSTHRSALAKTFLVTQHDNKKRHLMNVLFLFYFFIF